MPNYRYQGRDRFGKIKRGKASGATPRDVTMALREKGIAVINLTEVKETLWNRELTLERSVKSQDFVVYLRQFSTLLNAGVPVVDATSLLAEQTESPALKKALFGIETELRAGHPFSESAAKYPKIFPLLFVNMLKAGELSGNLETSLERLADYYEKQHATTQKIKSALVYPISVSIIAVAVIIFMLTFVIPRFQAMFASFNTQLPLITRMVLGTSRWMTTFWWLIMIIICALVISMYILSRQSRIHYQIDRIKLKMPIFGPLLQKAAIARFSRTLSSLLASSVPILQAVDMVGKVVGNKVIEKKLIETRVAVESGESIASSMKNSVVIPPLVTQMMAIGEQTGALDSMLAKVADFYESEVEHTTDRLKSLIEPVMILILAGIVGFIVLSVFLPMFKLYNQLG
ncbi:type II secretion system F family protein [Tuberibacillus calidus]|uniref:type II secretion system F family protein n=1 Tax=Tuberibacillus calidus TaxID=340097 RepID=UPI000480426C|nr:type II secretion system F family protein [Tuberibacillus calidus]